MIGNRAFRKNYIAKALHAANSIGNQDHRRRLFQTGCLQRRGVAAIIATAKVAVIIWNMIVKVSPLPQKPSQ